MLSYLSFIAKEIIILHCDKRLKIPLSILLNTSRIVTAILSYKEQEVAVVVVVVVIVVAAAAAVVVSNF
jgi:hypothetical protein